MPHNETYINGVWLPSVTTIISGQEKPWLTAWREKWGIRAERKTAIANAIGTAFHSCIEEYLERGCWAVNIPAYPSCERRVNAMMKVWKKWAESINGDVVATELRVINRRHKYSGTVDCIVEFKNV